jgi:hypothetical protein
VKDRPAAIDVLHQMRQVSAPVTSAAAEHARRERICARVSELQVEFDRTTARRRRWRPIALVAAPLFMAAGMMLWLGWSRATVSEVGVGGESAAGSEQTELWTRNTVAALATAPANPGVGQEPAFEFPREMVVEASTEQLQLPSSATLKATLGTRLSVDRERVQGDHWRETVSVVSGELEIEIPKFDPQTHLIVRTKSVTIDVESTHFAIDVPVDPKQPTRVNVIEGKLTVRTWAGMRVVAAGQLWEFGDQAPSNARAASTTVGEASAASNLREANRSMQGALLAKTGGMKELALQRFTELIQRYPETEAAATARAERFRLLAQMGRAAAARQAAKNYLAAHPDGFASREARTLFDATE